MKIRNIKRSQTEGDLIKFIKAPGAGLVYFRGRRRVGKSTLLKKLQEENENVFYFSGVDDETTDKTHVRFVRSWDGFLGQKKLTRFKVSELSWELIFDELTSFAQIEKKLVIIFDEIQWIAKGRSGMVGVLKEKWLDWEQTGKIKVIICGSSNKFFVDKVGGEEKILRGVKTRSDIVLPQLNLDEVMANYFKGWNLNEFIFSYFVFGGVPYYLNQVPEDKNFFRAMNTTFFTRETIFLSEVDEILNLEFNSAGVVKVKEILKALGPNGSTQAEIKKKILISDSTLSDSIKKLLDYNVIKEKRIYKDKKSNTRNAIYFYDDPYLLFYFCVLDEHKKEISENDDRLIFSEIINSSRSYYIPNFTGRAFEVFIRNLLAGEKNDVQKRLLSALKIPDKNFDIYDSYSKIKDVDILLDHKRLRSLILIECKWSFSQEVIDDGIKQLKKVALENAGIPMELFLITNYDASKKLIERAMKEGVTIITTKVTM